MDAATSSTRRVEGEGPTAGFSAMRPRAVALTGVGKQYRLYPSDAARVLEIITGRARHQVVQALANLSLDLGHGEVLGIVGRNGAGKSTLLKIIAGLMPASEGRVEIDGRVGAILELGAAFHPEMTGRENVRMQAAISGLTRGEIDALLPEVADFADIGAFLDRPVKLYSSGMSARLAFAVATAIDPDILIIDEALSVGDGAFARKSFDRIMAFRDAGKTILFCSHSIYHVQSICDRVLWLEQGSVKAIGGPEEVLNCYQATLDAASAQDDQPPGAEPATTPEQSFKGRLLSVEVSADGIVGVPLRLRSGASRLSIRASYRVDPALPVPSVFIALSTADNRPVFGAVSLHDQVQLRRDASGAGSVSLSFPAIPLLRGQYSVQVFLACERALHVYDQATLDRALEVEQADYSAGAGLVELAREWQVDEP